MTSPAGAPHPGGVFTGDTLFVAGCGRFFEGTGAEMHAALAYLAALPPQTVVYDGHEYTKGNLAFAKSVDPANPALARLEGLVAAGAQPAERTTIADEKEWNPFMRLGSAAIECVSGSSSCDAFGLWMRGSRRTRCSRKATGGGEPGAAMDKLRELKNNFRG